MKNAFRKLSLRSPRANLTLLLALAAATLICGGAALALRSAPLQIASLCLTLALCAHVLFIYAIPFFHVFSFTQAPGEHSPEEFQCDPRAREIFEYFQNRVEQEAARRSMEQLNEIADIKLLQSQINPHFLYNTLDSVRGELYLREMYDIADMVEALSSLFRFNIDQKKMLIPFEEELANTEKYVRIMQFRFSDKFRLLKQFDEMDERIMNYPIPKLTLQPIIENAIHHGLETKIGAGVIILRVQYTDRTMIITIEDDGAGMSPEALSTLNRQLATPAPEPERPRRNGIALHNINERISLLYGPEYGLSVASCSGRGTQVTLMLPMRPAPEESTED